MLAVVFSQNRFEKGYFLDSKGNRVECYIKNLNWSDSPTRISHKSSLDDEPQLFDVTTAKAFQVNGDNDRVFLIQVGDNKPLPLLHKRYIRPDSNQIVDNKVYRRQLLEYLNRGNSVDIQSVIYEKKSLLEYVQKYNLCIGSDNTDLDMEVEKSRKIKFGLTFYGGVQDYGFNYEVFGRNQDYDNEIVPKVGLEMEGVLPFNNNKWSFFLGTYYSEYSSGFGAPNVGSPRYFIDIKRLEAMLGGRHYMYLNSNNALFLAMANDFNSQHRIDFNQDFGDCTEKSNPVNFGGAVGLGYTFTKSVFKVQLLL